MPTKPPSFRGKSVQELHRLRDHHQQRLNSTNDASFRSYHQNVLISIEGELKRAQGPAPRPSAKRQRATAAKPSAPRRARPSAPRQQTPDVDIVSTGDKALAIALAAASPPPGGPSPPPPRTWLPPDFVVALEHERAQYRPVVLRQAEDVTIDDNGLVSLVPSPPGDEGWLAGTIVGLAGNDLRFSGEIVHLDPKTGRIYASPPTRDAASTAHVGVDKWCVQPFDFSAAVLAAAAAAEGRQSQVLANLTASRGASTPLSAFRAEDKEQQVWRQPWALLWGPPGTGKTEVTSRLIAADLMAGQERIVAVAPTNRAVDNLALRVARRLNAAGVYDVGALMFRGGVGAGREIARDFPSVLRDADYAERLREIAYLEERLRHLEARRTNAADIAELRRQIAVKKKFLRDETDFVVGQGKQRLILLSLHRALRLVSELGGEAKFDKLVVDEAGMVARAAGALVALLARSALFAGDPRQIGPISRGEGAGKAVATWLKTSPLSHLSDPKDASAQPNVLFLREQHRMHKDISSVVSRFRYSGQLLDGPEIEQRPARAVAGLPHRAAWVPLLATGADAHRIYAARAENGRGYVRELSAELTIQLAMRATDAGLSVLAMTPYRAQVRILNDLGTQTGLPVDRFTASTIHRQQGTEADVVLLDTVAAGRPFADEDLMAMLNVAASRAREFLYVIAARGEAERRVPGLLVRLLPQLAVVERSPIVLGTPQQARVPQPAPAVKPGSLRAEIDAISARGTLFTAEQVALFRRRIGMGHHVVRGVAGSGKTYVLAHWVASHVEQRRGARVLVTYFNKALGGLVQRLIEEALEARGIGDHAHLVVARHVDVTGRYRAGDFDAVFVDEAQDIEPADLRRLYHLAVSQKSADGEGLRNFNLFMDDSQNVYGRNGLDDLKERLGERLSFSGRSSVLREAFRSTRQTLDLAFNVVLDPHGRHGGTSPGMREFMKARELLEHGLLEDSADRPDGLFRVLYTERVGIVPIVRRLKTQIDEATWIAWEIKQLVETEDLRARDFLVVVPSRPSTWAGWISKAGVPAIGFGGTGGADPTQFADAHSANEVRITTVFSAKGHESPIVFFAGLDSIDNIDDWMNEVPGENPSPRNWERRRRAIFYVGATRAMIRQYVSGTNASRFARVAEHYAGLMAGHAALSPLARPLGLE